MLGRATPSILYAMQSVKLECLGEGWLDQGTGGRNTAIAITVINIINNFNNWPLKAVFEVHV